MSEKKPEPINFSALFKDAKPVKHDKYVPNKRDKARNAARYTAQIETKKAANENMRDSLQRSASVHLSDGYEAHWPPDKPIKFIRTENIQDREQTWFQKDLLKKLSMGHIPPDIEIDLHGLTSAQAKEEIESVVFEAKKRHYPCINIVHGHGNGVLKQKVPNWLVQHPDIAGFVQAPRAYGGKAGLLVLIGVDFTSLKMGE